MNRLRGTHWPQVTWREHWTRNNTEVVNRIIADIHKNCYACNNPAFGMTMKVEFRNRNNDRARPDHLRAAPEIVRAPRRQRIPTTPTATTTTTSQQAGEMMNPVQTVNNERAYETGAIDRKNKNVGRDLDHRFRLETPHKCGNIHPERTYANVHLNPYTRPGSSPTQVEGSPDTSSWDEEDPSTLYEPGTGAATSYPQAVPSSYRGVDHGRGRGQDLLKRLKLWPNNNSSTTHPEKTIELTDENVTPYTHSGSSPTQVEGSTDTSSWDEEDPSTLYEPGTGAATSYPQAVPSSYRGVDHGRGRGQDLLKRLKLWPNNYSSTTHPEKTVELTDENVTPYTHSGSSPTQVEGSTDTSSWDEEDPSTLYEPGTGAATSYPQAVPSSYRGVDHGRGRGQDLLKRLKLWPNNYSSTTHPEKTVELTDENVTPYTQSGSSPTQVEGSTDTSSWDEEDSSIWAAPGTSTTTPLPRVVPSSYWGVDRGRGRGQDLLNRVRKWRCSFGTSSWDEEDPSTWDEPGTGAATPYPRAVPSSRWEVERGRGRGRDILNRLKRFEMTEELTPGDNHVTPSVSSSFQTRDFKNLPARDEPNTSGVISSPCPVPSSSQAGGSAVTPALEKPSNRPGSSSSQAGNFGNLSAEDQPSTGGVAQYNGQAPSSSQLRVFLDPLTSDESSSSDETPCTSPGLASSREVVRDRDQSTMNAISLNPTRPAIDYWAPSRCDGVDGAIAETPSSIPPSLVWNAENVMRTIAALNTESRILVRERENFVENLQSRLSQNLNIQFNMTEILIIFGNPADERVSEMLYMRLLKEQIQDASPGSGSRRRNFRDEYKKKKRGDKF
ncbi:uncharacterized protein LOC118265929 isoform X1 [Spodoptera frugiperda]|uniref:Uncharacterized protein LOC118265929 isoform X1 n=1 Tax=Spodoptera frugiperda TaxID=7108 RepID=A0A9R0E6K0_SPOFR|nr:uncharacterized protein LOC118265929 isoform X1 [Spodoptera frugiperda]